MEVRWPRWLATLHRLGRSPTTDPVHTFLGNHDVARLSDVIAADLRSAAFAVLLTFPGIPGIYYGDEVGATSPWTTGGSDALLRPPLAVTDIDVDGAGAELLDTVRRLGELRRARPWLTTATIDDVADQDGAIGYRTVGPDGQSLGVAINPTSDRVVLPRTTGRLLLGTAGDHGDTRVELAPRGWAIFG